MPCQRVDCTKQDFNGMPESHYSKSLSADQMTFLKKKIQTKVCGLNHITATGCKVFRLKGACTSLQNSTFSGPVTNLFSILCILTEILSCQCEKETKRLKNVKFHTFTGCFQVTAWQ